MSHFVWTRYIYVYLPLIRNLAFKVTASPDAKPGTSYTVVIHMQGSNSLLLSAALLPSRAHLCRIDDAMVPLPNILTSAPSLMLEVRISCLNLTVKRIR